MYAKKCLYKSKIFHIILCNIFVYINASTYNGQKDLHTQMFVLFMELYNKAIGLFFTIANSTAIIKCGRVYKTSFTIPNPQSKHQIVSIIFLNSCLIKYLISIMICKPFQVIKIRLYVFNSVFQKIVSKTKSLILCEVKSDLN